MSSHNKHLPLFQDEYRVILDSVFRCCRSNVESHSTALSAVQGRMSGHTRKRFRPFQVECQVTRQRFPTFNLNIELYSTALSDLPGRMSSHRHPFFCCFRSNVESLESALCCSRSNVESPSTVLSALRGRMSSHIVQRLPTFQVECRVIRQRHPAFHVQCRGTFDSAYRHSSLNVESH